MNIRLIFLSLIAFTASAIAQTTNQSVMTHGNQVVHDTKTFDGVIVSGSFITQPGTSIRIGNIALQWNGLDSTACIEADGSKHGLMVHTSGTQGSAIIGYSQSGAPGLLFAQDTNFDSPAVMIERTGIAGDVASSPTMLVRAGLETSGTTPILKVGGCLALSGDNWVIVWGDGALSLPGGVLDSTGSTHGKIAIDPVHRQLVGPDGISQAASWATGVFTVPSIAVTSAPASAYSPGIPGQISFDSAHVYRCTAPNTWVRAPLTFSSW
jgi:hypothetical protein